jgi:hypothetical protein
MATLDDVMTELRIVRKMNEAILKDRGQIQWVDGWAAGSNDGGMFVSLYHSRAKYRICQVYSEQFFLLPDFVKDHIPDGAGEVSNDRDRMEKSGKLRQCAPFRITRYKLNHDDEKEMWRFGDYLYHKRDRGSAAAPPANADPTTVPAKLAPPVVLPPELDRPFGFTSLKDALQWACECQVYATYEESRAAYDRLKIATAPASAAIMHDAWIENAKRRFNPAVYEAKRNAEAVHS